MAANVFNTKSRAPAPPEIAHDDSSTASLIDVDSPHISSVSSDYQGETKTQVEREEHETEEAEREAREKFNQVSDETGKELREGKKEAHAKGKEAKHKAREVAHDANEKAKEAAREIKKDAKIAGQKAKEAGHEMDDRAREAGHDLKENRDNPVVIANALVIGLGSAALGFGAYRKYKAGELNWQVGGMWAGAIGLFALGDYYLSQYLFKNKYPRK
ncbi:hypothetical protein MMC19_002535 [Ptychographa xylographoides]|nr:hypothetical protein [Ptychographa xylographoides]